MAKYEIAYAIFRDDVQLAISTIEVSLTKKDILEFEKFAIEHNYSPKFADMSANIHEKCMTKARESAPKLCKEIGEELTSDITLVFAPWIPSDLINALSDETRNRIYENQRKMYPEIIEDNDKHITKYGDVAESKYEKTATFVLNIQDIFLIHRKGLFFDGTVVSGRCKAGDKCVLIDKDENIICETTIYDINVGRSGYKNFDEFENTEGLQVGILTPLKNRNDAKDAVAVVVKFVDNN